MINILCEAGIEILDFIRHVIHVLIGVFLVVVMVNTAFADDPIYTDNGDGTANQIQKITKSDIQSNIDILNTQIKNYEGQKASRLADIDDINNKEQVIQKTLTALTNIISTMK